MDFFTTTQSTAVPININGTPYSLPRFLLPALKKWAAVVKQQMEEDNTRDFDTDAKARFKTYFQPVIDIAHLMQMAATPEGAEYVVRSSMNGVVPADVIDAVIAQADPLMLRGLADRLLDAQKVLANLGAANDPNPLPSTPPASGGLPETGATTTPDLPPSTT